MGHCGNRPHASAHAPPLLGAFLITATNSLPISNQWGAYFYSWFEEAAGHRVGATAAECPAASSHLCRSEAQKGTGRGSAGWLPFCLSSILTSEKEAIKARLPPQSVRWRGKASSLVSPLEMSLKTCAE